MKFKHEETITIPVPEQFQKAWGPIAYNWLQRNHENYPDSIIESIDPNITYYRRYDGENMMEGEINIEIVTYKDVTNPNFDF